MILFGAVYDSMPKADKPIRFNPKKNKKTKPNPQEWLDTRDDKHPRMDGLAHRDHSSEPTLHRQEEEEC